MRFAFFLFLSLHILNTAPNAAPKIQDAAGKMLGETLFTSVDELAREGGKKFREMKQDVEDHFKDFYTPEERTERESRHHGLCHQKSCSDNFITFYKCLYVPVPEEECLKAGDAAMSYCASALVPFQNRRGADGKFDPAVLKEIRKTALQTVASKGKNELSQVAQVLNSDFFIEFGSLPEVQQIYLMQIVSLLISKDQSNLGEEFDKETLNLFSSTELDQKISPPKSINDLVAALFFGAGDLKHQMKEHYKVILAGLYSVAFSFAKELSHAVFADVSELTQHGMHYGVLCTRLHCGESFSRSLQCILEAYGTHRVFHAQCAKAALSVVLGERTDKFPGWSAHQALSPLQKQTFLKFAQYVAKYEKNRTDPPQLKNWVVILKNILDKND